MANVSLKDLTIAETYDLLLVRNNSWSATGNEISLMNDSGVIQPSNFYIDPTNDRIGIGETAPDHLLEIKGTDNHLSLHGTDSGNNVVLQFVEDGTEKGLIQWDGGNDYLGIYSGDGASIILDGDNVGIGNAAIETWEGGYTALQIGGRCSISTATTEADGANVHISNNLYLDTTTPGWQRQRNDETCMYILGGAGTHTWYTDAAGTADADMTPTARMTILNNGNVGIGTTSPGIINSQDIDGGGEGGMLHLKSALPQLIFEDTDIGSTNKNFKIWVDGTSGLRWSTIQNDNGTIANVFVCGSGGELSVPDVYNSTAGSANVSVASGGRITRITSSKRYKDNINYDGVDASVLYSMKPCSYIEKSTGTEFIGLVAEDVDEIEPRLVEYREIDGKDEPDAIKYDHISAILIKAIQELSAKVTALENA